MIRKWWRRKFQLDGPSDDAIPAWHRPPEPKRLSAPAPRTIRNRLESGEITRDTMSGDYMMTVTMGTKRYGVKVPNIVVRGEYDFEQWLDIARGQVAAKFRKDAGQRA